MSLDRICPLCQGNTGLCNGSCMQQAGGGTVEIKRPPYSTEIPSTWPLGPVPKGCICPPTAEQTCQRSDCGRKDPQWRTK